VPERTLPAASGKTAAAFDMPRHLIAAETEGIDGASSYASARLIFPCVHCISRHIWQTPAPHARLQCSRWMTTELFVQYHRSLDA